MLNDPNIPPIPIEDEYIPDEEYLRGMRTRLEGVYPPEIVDSEMEFFSLPYIPTKDDKFVMNSAYNVDPYANPQVRMTPFTNEVLKKARLQDPTTAEGIMRGFRGLQQGLEAVSEEFKHDILMDLASRDTQWGGSYDPSSRSRASFTGDMKPLTPRSRYSTISAWLSPDDYLESPDTPRDNPTMIPIEEAAKNLAIHELGHSSADKMGWLGPNATYNRPDMYGGGLPLTRYTNDTNNPDEQFAEEFRLALMGKLQKMNKYFPSENPPVANQSQALLRRFLQR